MLPEAYVTNGTLALERQAFKAFVLRGNDTLTVAGVEKLVEFAQAGLPIIISGGLPQNLTGFNASGGTEYVRSALSSIASLENVHVVPYDNLAASVKALGLTPKTSVSANRIWYTHWREDANASVSYTFIYNDAYDSELGEGASMGSVTFETTGVPYVYDAWTGDVAPILAYQQTSTTTTIPLSLAGNQSAIIAFHHNETTAGSTKVLSFPDEVYSASQAVYGSSQVTLKVGNSSEPVLLSNGTAIDLPVPAASTILSNWTLIVESWSPPSDLYADQTKAVLSNRTYHPTTLEAWGEISDSLRNVSGRGFYSTTFTWPPQNGSADGAMLSLGVIVHTARVWINGHQLAPLDPTDPIADIGTWLMNGTNTVEVVVSTTLGNVLRPIYEEMRSSGTIWLGPQPVEQAYGLLQPVNLKPYNTITLSL